MQYDDGQNPYSPPVAETTREDAEDTAIPATRGTRWLARFIDTMLNMALYLPLFTYLYLSRVLTWQELSNNVVITGIYWAASAPVSIYQWILISRTGQSLGKRWMRIKVVRTNGEKVGFVEGVLLREWITGVIALIPGLGQLINVIGILLIFGEERRCLHDRFAGTKVVQLLGR